MVILCSVLDPKKFDVRSLDLKNLNVESLTLNTDCRTKHLHIFKVRSYIEVFRVRAGHSIAAGGL